jgi:hemolysin activation/secretion protein
MLFSRSGLLSLTSVLLFPALALAQTAIPSTSDPARLPQRLEQPVRPTRAAPLVVAPDVDGRAPKGAEKMRFHLRSVKVVGASVYDEATLATAWADMLGREVRVDEVFALAAKLTVRYRTDGYVI